MDGAIVGNRSLIGVTSQAVACTSGGAGGGLRMASVFMACAAADEEGSTYDNRINRISTIQEHHMLRRAVALAIPCLCHHNSLK
jgi:hypothetical protein